MKLEKLNNNQIRCTFTKEDLASRDIKLSEFAYGSVKAKELFREVMSWASYEFGFETNNTPLMVEAVPLSKDSIMLIVTKVDNPDVLDSRFSKYSPSSDEEMDDMPFDSPSPKKKASKKIVFEPQNPSDDNALFQLFVFDSMNDVILAAKNIPDFTENTDSMIVRLYFDPQNKNYRLYTENQREEAKEEYNRINVILREYGDHIPLPKSGDAYLKEHCELVMDSNVFATLKTL